MAPGWTLTPLAPGFGGPDDLYVAADGTLYFSDIVAGKVGALAPSGGPASVLARGLQVPEGIAPLADGALLVVEQGKNRIVRVDRATGTFTPWRSLSNPTALEGADNITAATAGLLVPDSPTGRLLLLPWDGGPAQVLTTGLTRPTSVLRAAGGTLYLTDEIGDALVALPPKAPTPARLAALHRPDDVVAGPQGSLLVACLDGTLEQVDPRTGAATAIVSGLGSPQGLTPDGPAYALSDETGNRLYRLTPPRSAPLPAQTGP